MCFVIATGFGNGGRTDFAGGLEPEGCEAADALGLGALDRGRAEALGQLLARSGSRLPAEVASVAGDVLILSGAHYRGLGTLVSPAPGQAPSAKKSLRASSV